MKPVSMARVRSPSATRWVSAWPPRRSSASKRVTRADFAATWGAVNPATPEPITATRVPIPMGLGLLEGDERDRRQRRLLRPARGLDGDAGTGRRGRVTLEEDPLLAAPVHQAGRHHADALVVEPELVDLAVRGRRHVAGEQHRLVEGG